jgi:hypothetical protein
MINALTEDYIMVAVLSILDALSDTLEGGVVSVETNIVAVLSILDARSDSADGHAQPLFYHVAVLSILDALYRKSSRFPRYALSYGVSGHLTKNTSSYL